MKQLLSYILTTVGLLLPQMLGVYPQIQLPRYNVDTTKISVSGVSSGGNMATQLHVAYSSVFMGVGVLAGAPYYCAKGMAAAATGRCVNDPDQIDVPSLVEETFQYEGSEAIDPTSNMATDRVFVFNGLQDSAVFHGIAEKVVEYYQNFIGSANIRLEKIEAEHTVPTEDYGNECLESVSPFISKCQYNAAFELLDHIYGGLNRPDGTEELTGDFYLFDQSEFFYIGQPSGSGMDDAGYIYVPSGCMFNQNLCKLHVALHGCMQNRESIQDVFALNAGYNAVGEINNIIILYPQTISTLTHPLACWDWWGYTNRDYATKDGNQPLAIWRMVDRLS